MSAGFVGDQPEQYRRLWFGATKLCCRFGRRQSRAAPPLTFGRARLYPAAPRAWKLVVGPLVCHGYIQGWIPGQICSPKYGKHARFGRFFTI